MHLEIILCHLSLGPHFHNITGFVYGRWNTIFFTCLRTSLQSCCTLALRVSKGSDGTIQEAQLWFELVCIRSPKVCLWQTYWNVSIWWKSSVVTHLITLQGIQLSHKSLVTCLHYVFVMEIQLPALRWQNPADVTYFSSVWTNDLKAEVSTFAYYSANSLSLSFSVNSLPETMVGWGGEGEPQTKTTPDSVPLKEPQEENFRGYQWQKHTQTRRKREKKTPFWDFKRRVEHAHTIPFGRGAKDGKCCNSNMLCSEKVLMVQPSCVITHKQERPCRTVGVF